jgi:C1A family cysteine protease
MNRGLGALQSPPDLRDFQTDELASVQLVGAPPASYTVSPLPPVYDQGLSPMCVAYSTSTVKAAEDLRDQKHNYRWDRPWFFSRIGGGPNGAVLRNAMDRMLKVGYPLLPSASGNSQASHRIAAYYAVPKHRLDSQKALMALGACVLAMPWFNSWGDTHTDGRLPVPDYQIGGHAIAIIGWRESGFLLRNSWGIWGVNGNCILPWAYLSAVWEIWKSVDVIEKP